mmetsp:Transcript_6880/g.18030  ORF Transcript_6880/g.18030 Transcript_6880/m.18030 type:complete len:315 (+) Transcript_6880:132-1076(+)
MIRLVLLHSPAPGASASAAIAAVYATHARLRRALRAPSRLLEALPWSNPLAAAAKLSRSRPLLLAALGPAALCDGPAPEPDFAAAELFSFESPASLRAALRQAGSELALVLEAREAIELRTRFVGLRCAEVGAQFGAAGAGGEPCGLGHDIGILITAHARTGLPRVRVLAACEQHASLVAARSAALGFRHALHGSAIREGELPSEEVAGALGSVYPATLDAFGVVAYSSLSSLAAAVASPTAQAATLDLLRHEAKFAHTPATALTLVRWRPVPHALDRREEALPGEQELQVPVGLALACEAQQRPPGSAGANSF